MDDFPRLRYLLSLPLKLPVRTRGLSLHLDTATLSGRLFRLSVLVGTSSTWSAAVQGEIHCTAAARIPVSPFLPGLRMGWQAVPGRLSRHSLHRQRSRSRPLLSIFYKYTDYLELTDFQTVVASIPVGVSSGVGGLAGLTGLTDRLPFQSADLWVPELTTYWSLLWNPLFPYSLLLMLWVIYQIDRGSRFKRKRDMWLAGLTAGLLALVHPYSQPVLLALAVIVITVRVREQAPSYLIR